MASGFSRTKAQPSWRPASAGPGRPKLASGFSRTRADALPPAVDDSSRIAELEGFIRESKFKEVEPLLAEYVKQRPASSWGWYALGYSLFAQQKIGESIKALAKSLELDIRNAEAHKILGRNLMIIGRFDAAQVEFEQALRYKPDSAEAHYNLGKLFSDSGQLGAGAEGIRGGASDRSVVHRGARRPGLRAGSAGRRCRRDREV